MAISYKELGLVNTRDMFKRAVSGGYAVPAFNFNNLEQLQAIITAAAQLKSPVILQVSKGARNYANQTYLRGRGGVQSQDGCYPTPWRKPLHPQRGSGAKSG